MERGRKSERKTEKSLEHQEETGGWRRRRWRRWQRGWLNPRSVCEEQMAFCSYFKIQPVAGGADRIKKSEWKLVSHDNSQPLRERQLLLLLSPDSTFPCHLRSVTVSLFPPSAYTASSPRSPFLFPCLTEHGSSLLFSLIFLSYIPSGFSRPPPRLAILPIYLSHSRYSRYYRRPSLSPSSTALNTTAAGIYGELRGI